MPIPPLANVSSRYGAPMGRRSIHAVTQAVPAKFHLARMSLDSGGYDAGGAYWGHGTPLWRVVSVDEYPVAYDPFSREPAIGRVTQYYRAASREEAKSYVLREYPNAKFFR